MTLEPLTASEGSWFARGIVVGMAFSCLIVALIQWWRDR